VGCGVCGGRTVCSEVSVYGVARLGDVYGGILRGGGVGWVFKVAPFVNKLGLRCCF